MFLVYIVTNCMYINIYKHSITHTTILLLYSTILLYYYTTIVLYYYITILLLYYTTILLLFYSYVNLFLNLCLLIMLASLHCIATNTPVAVPSVNKIEMNSLDIE